MLDVQAVCWSLRGTFDGQLIEAVRIWMTTGSCIGWMNNAALVSRRALDKINELECAGVWYIKIHLHLGRVHDIPRLKEIDVVCSTSNYRGEILNLATALTSSHDIMSTAFYITTSESYPYDSSSSTKTTYIGACVLWLKTFPPRTSPSLSPSSSRKSPGDTDRHIKSSRTRNSARRNGRATVNAVGCRSRSSVNGPWRPSSATVKAVSCYTVRVGLPTTQSTELT